MFFAFPKLFSGANKIMRKEEKKAKFTRLETFGILIVIHLVYAYGTACFDRIFKLSRVMIGRHKSKYGQFNVFDQSRYLMLTPLLKYY